MPDTVKFNPVRYELRCEDKTGRAFIILHEKQLSGIERLKRDKTLMALNDYGGTWHVYAVTEVNGEITSEEIK